MYRPRKWSGVTTVRLQLSRVSTMISIWWIMLGWYVLFVYSASTRTEGTFSSASSYLAGK